MPHISATPLTEGQQSTTLVEENVTISTTDQESRTEQGTEKEEAETGVRVTEDTHEEEHEKRSEREDFVFSLFRGTVDEPLLERVLASLSELPSYEQILCLVCLHH